MNDELILAIDFGTSNSLVGAIYKGKHFEALPLDPLATDPTLLRTLLYFPSQDVCYYGLDAIKQFEENDMQGRLFRSFKTHLPNREYLGTILDNRILTLETIIGVFLLEIKKRAEKHFNCQSSTVILGRPARYSMDPLKDNFAKHRMEKAAQFAGFKDIQFVPEPLAAAFDFRKKLDKEKTVLVGDFGGGTSDFTLIRMGPFDFKQEHVLAIDGCPMAGDALDSLFMKYKLSDWFGAKTRYRMLMSQNIFEMPPLVMERLNHPAHIVHLREKETYEYLKTVQKCALSLSDKKAMERLFVLIEDQQVFSLFENIEQTKRHLTDHKISDFVYDYPGIEIKETFTKLQFEDWAQATKDKIFASLDECLKSAGVRADQVDSICLTGGTGKVPLIREELTARFGKERLQTQSNFHSVLSGLVEAAGFYTQGLKI